VISRNVFQNPDYLMPVEDFQYKNRESLPLVAQKLMQEPIKHDD